jgi:hypothetical protein
MGGKKKVVRRKETKPATRGKRKTPAVKKYANQLKLLVQCPAQTRNAMISKGDTGLIQALCECALNILKGHVHLSTKQKGNLQRHKTDLRNLADKAISLQKKRKILQKGGFIPMLLKPLVAPILGTVLGKITKSVSKKIFG